MSTLQDLPSRKTEGWQLTASRALSEAFAVEAAPAARVTWVTEGPFLTFRGGPILVNSAVDAALRAHADPRSRRDGFLSLNHTHALHLRVDVYQPVHLQIAYEGGSSFPRLHIDVGDGREITVEERFSGTHTTCSFLSFDIGTGSSVRHVQHFAVAGRLLHYVDCKLSRGSTYHATSIQSSGETVRLDSVIELNGEGATCDIAGAILAQGSDTLDAHVRILHRAPRTESLMNFRTVARDNATAVFDGQAHVLAGAVHCEAHQQSRALLLSEHAHIHAKPHLEIYVDEVKASHGSTVGSLDSDQLFYLESRGIPRAEAESILVEAFLHTVSDRIADESLREEIAAEITRATASHI